MAVSTGYIFSVVVILQIILKLAFSLRPLNEIKVMKDLLDRHNDIPVLQVEIAKISKNGGLKKYKLGNTNDDKYLNATQLMEKYGYKTETHFVTTEDGYKPSMYRIPGDGAPVLIMHGMGNSAVDFVTVGPNKALPYLLANEGYDVWMGNARGSSEDARGHVHLSADSDIASYWDFSWDEIGRYDVPAMIDYILAGTGQTKLKYVGHSQGTTIFFVLCSERPEYNNKISLMVALSAVAWMSHLTSPLVRLGGNAIGPHAEMIRNVIGFYKMTPDNRLIQIMTKKICGNTELAKLVCSNLSSMFSGFNYAQLNVTNLPVIFAHTPGGIATKQFLHYAQELVSGAFRQYDYGLMKNLGYYGSVQPPNYQVEKITAPVAIFYKKKGDWMVGYEDVRKLRKKLPNVVEFAEVPCKNFCHTDYIWAKDVKELLYNSVLELFKKY